MNQDEAPVTFSIVKAKIRAQKWNITHERAKKTYAEERRPKKQEARWKTEVRRLYGRLRTSHAKELKAYRKFINTEEDDTCEECGQGEENINHVLCECSTEENQRRIHHSEPVKIEMLVSHPEICRRILERRFPRLKQAKGSSEDQTEQQ
jgi:hypothetical protein